MNPAARPLLAATLLAACLATPLPLHAGAGNTAADLAVQQAREAARDNRHAVSIEAFRAALDANPGRRSEWLLEWADQHTWAGRLSEAIQLYREALASLDFDGRQAARVGLARALAWSGRLKESVAVYDEALAAVPGDREAQLGRARVQSWRGRHRDATARMQQFLVEHPQNREATLVLAESLAWMGRADRALPVLRDHVSNDAGDARSAALLQQLERDIRPSLRLDWRDTDQSDGLRISETAWVSRWPWADGRGQVAARFSRTSYRPSVGRAFNILVHRPGVEMSHRIDDALAWSGAVWLDMIEPRNGQGRHRLWTHDTHLTWRPVDRWRFDLGSARWTFDSEEALRKGLTALQLKLSADFLPDELTRLTVRLNQADVSDGNRREGWQLEAERRVWDTPRVHLGLLHTGYGYLKPGQGGYFNPAKFRSNELWLQSSGRVLPGLDWNLRWSTGHERSVPADSRPVRSGSASLSWDIEPGLTLEMAYDHSTSRTQPSGGFQRGIARLTLRHQH